MVPVADFLAQAFESDLFAGGLLLAILTTVTAIVLFRYNNKINF